MIQTYVGSLLMELILLKAVVVIMTVSYTVTPAVCTNGTQIRTCTDLNNCSPLRSSGSNLCNWEFCE